MIDDIKAQLIDLVGENAFSASLIDLVSYSYDASDHSHRPEAVVWPTDATQISGVLKLANAHKIPVIARGAGTSMSGSTVPIRGGLIMDLCRMNRIVEIKIEDRLVRVQPGVVYSDLDDALKPTGFFFPPDPASGKVCTIGGNVATNAGGIRGAKYGVTRDYVLGLEVVLADGRIARTGTDCMKSSSGLDLTRLFVGSEGTLGVVAEVTLKVSPRPTELMTAQALFSSLEQAGRAVSGIMTSGVIPAVMEILDRNSIAAVRRGTGLDLPEAEAMLLVEVDGFIRADVEYQMDRVTAIFEKNGADKILRAETVRESEALWAARKKVGSAAAAMGPNNISDDVTAPISEAANLLTGIAAIVSDYDLPFVVFGHAGDGNLHPKIMYDRSDPDQAAKVRQAVDRIFELTCSLRGTLTGEHGVGLEKAPYMHLEHDRTSLDLMQSIKTLLDPNNILNPGKMGFK